jgi:hypothetical protein
VKSKVEASSKGVASVAAGFYISETVWLPMLHGFVERNRIGRLSAPSC